MKAISNICNSSERYPRCIQTSKRVHWDIDKDVIRGRNFDTAPQVFSRRAFSCGYVHDPIGQ
jgi:hypothetical protein